LGHAGRLDRLELFDELHNAARWQLAALGVRRDGQVFEVVLAQPSGQPSRGALWPTVRLRTIVTAPTFDVSAVTVAYRLGSNEGAETELLVEHQVPPCLCAGDDEVVLGPEGGLPPGDNDGAAATRGSEQPGVRQLAVGAGDGVQVDAGIAHSLLTGQQGRTS
jgi:hypothetical protein